MHMLVVVGSAWHWNVAGLFCCGILLAIYAALTSLRPSRALAWFVSGDILLALIVCSPLDLFARQYLLTAESVEQMLIALVVTNLLVLGTTEKAVRRLRLDRLALPYYAAWFIGMGTLFIWHLPRMLDWTLASESVRCLEYATLLLSGAVFWWPIQSPLRKQRMPMVPNSLLYLAAAVVWCSFLGLLLAFQQPGEYYVRTLDPLHIAHALINNWSFTPENDQETAGLLFWIGAAAVLLVQVMVVYYRWYSSSEIQNEQISRAEPIVRS